MALPAPYFQDENCTIYHGDCRELLPLVTADVVVTDPPYGIGWSRGKNKAANSKAAFPIANDIDTVARDEALDMLGHLPAIVFGSFLAPSPDRTRQVLVWKKPEDSGVHGAIGGFRRDIEPVYLVGPWPVNGVRWSGLLPVFALGLRSISAESPHPHAKPSALMRYLIERCPAGIILDPFMGSGTTLRAAKDLGRKAIGIEIEERYCEIAAKRLAQAVLPGMEVA